MDVNRISGYIPGKLVFYLMQVRGACAQIQRPRGKGLAWSALCWRVKQAQWLQCSCILFPGPLLGATPTQTMVLCPAKHPHTAIACSYASHPRANRYVLSAAALRAISRCGKADNPG
eukprot:351675-Chlamydomonas_euryale.AAC.6